MSNNVLSHPLRGSSTFLKSPGIDRVRLSSTSPASISRCRRELSISVSTTLASVRGCICGDVVSIPGVTGGVGLGVPPAKAAGGGFGEGSANMRKIMWMKERENMSGGSRNRVSGPSGSRRLDEDAIHQHSILRIGVLHTSWSTTWPIVFIQP